MIFLVLLTLLIAPWLVVTTLNRSANAAEKNAKWLEISTRIQGTIADATENLAEALLRIARLGEREEQEFLRLKREAEEEEENRFDPLEEDVKLALAKEDDRFGEDAIEVKRVGDGMILLTGCVEDNDDLNIALKIAREVPGVQKVYERLQPMDSWMMGNRSEGSFELSITELEELVIKTLEQDPLLKDCDIDVNEHGENEGFISLSGHVDNQEQFKRAEALTRDVLGVTAVINQIEIVGEDDSHNLIDRNHFSTGIPENSE